MPRRRCVGCGRTAPKSELVRLAVPREEGVRSRRAVLDSAGTLPGRGAYLCRRADAAAAAPNPDCLTLAVSRRGIARALRCAVVVDSKLVESVRGWRSQPQAGEPGPSTTPIIQ